MKLRALAGLSVSALMLGGTMVGCAQGGISSASSRNDAKLAKNAADNAEHAGEALAAGDTLKAIGLAEAAVAAMPQNADYRALLGASYLKAGRFTSAHAAYADVLTLAPNNGKAVLNMALAMIAEGQWDEARTLLVANAAAVPASDRGLAIALAGDPAVGIEVLTGAARSPDADAKTRQNLALALALGGRWAEAREVAGVDMTPDAADARMVQWASFAKPVGAADQVSALLGVTPIKDPGQPVALALNAAVPVASMAAAESAKASVAVAEVAPVPAPLGAGKVVFGERREVVQAIPAAPARTTVAPGGSRVRAAAAPRGAGKGNWFVQLGAYDSAAVAKDAWGRAQHRFPAFAEQVPTGMAFKSLYRLSVGGFSRGNANAMCRGYRAKGGSCFVRTGAGDQTASWARPARVQMAAR
jgi:Flp pilus assembly protein TadD